MALPPPAEGSAALVTGASSGIGVEIARELAARGHALILVARRQKLLEELAAELEAEHGVSVDPVAADVADPKGRDALSAHVTEVGTRIEVLVNNAGVGGFGNFHEVARDREVGMVRLNIEAVVDLTSRWLPQMVERGRGALITIASTAAFQPMPNNATYAATKAFVLNHCEAVAEELKGTGVSMTAICPGPVRTPFVETAGAGNEASSVPDFAWLEAHEVARVAVEGAENGSRVVVPGMLNRATALAGRHTPRSILLPLTRRAMDRLR